MNLNKIKRISIGTFLVFWTAMYGSCIYNNHQESNKRAEEKIAKLQEKQKIIDEENRKIEETKNYFNSNKNEILNNINELIGKGDFVNAGIEIDKYLKIIKDPLLFDEKTKLNIRIKEERLKEDISLDEKIKITNELVKISDDKKYQDLLSLLKNKKDAIDRQEIVEKIKKTDKTDINKNYELYSSLYTNYQPLSEKETKEMAYYMAEKTLSDNEKLQFRSIDGSNILVVNFVKKLMNDPNSFEHINTTVYKTDDRAFLDVVMMYRGKNAFGAKVVNTIKARVSLISNTILSIKNE